MGAYDGQTSSTERGNPPEPRKPPGYPSTARAKAVADAHQPGGTRPNEERASYPSSQ
jgi:hypothetical protein